MNNNTMLVDSTPTITTISSTTTNNNNNTNQDILVKLVFPPTSSIISKTILIRQNQRVCELVQYASQLAGLQPGYSLYIPNSKQTSRGQWLDDNSLFSFYSISSSDILHIKRKPGFKVRKNTLANLKGFKEGKVQKLSSFTNIWNPRFLRLYSQRIVHTSNENDSNTEFISFADIVNVDRDINRKYSFLIEYIVNNQNNQNNNNDKKETKEFIFRCTNQNETEEWIQAIRVMLKKARPDLFLPPLSVYPNQNINNNNNNSNTFSIPQTAPQDSRYLTLPAQLNNNSGNSNNSGYPTTPGPERSKSRSFSFSLSSKKKKEDVVDLNTSPSSNGLKSALQFEEELKQIKITLDRESKSKLEMEKKYLKLKKKYSTIKKIQTKSLQHQQQLQIQLQQQQSLQQQQQQTQPQQSGGVASSVVNAVGSFLTRSRSLSSPISPEKLVNNNNNNNNSNQNNLQTNQHQQNSNNNSQTSTSGSGFLSFFTPKKQLQNPPKPLPQIPQQTTTTATISSLTPPINSYSTPSTPNHHNNNWTPGTSPFIIGSTRLKSMKGGDRRSIDSSTGDNLTTETETFSVMEDDDDDESQKLAEIKELKDQLVKIKERLQEEVSKNENSERNIKLMEKDIHHQKRMEEKKERMLRVEKEKQLDSFESIGEITSRLKQSLVQLKQKLEEEEAISKELQHDDDEEDEIIQDNFNDISIEEEGVEEDQDNIIQQEQLEDSFSITDSSIEISNHNISSINHVAQITINNQSVNDSMDLSCIIDNNNNKND